MAEEAREDAVVIPIGTGGRPGRGSGSARPSSAARNLAPSAAKPAPKKRAAAKKTSPRKPAPAPEPAAEAPPADPR